MSPGLSVCAKAVLHRWLRLYSGYQNTRHSVYFANLYKSTVYYYIHLPGIQSRNEQNILGGLIFFLFWWIHLPPPPPPPTHFNFIILNIITLVSQQSENYKSEPFALIELVQWACLKIIFGVFGKFTFNLLPTCMSYYLTIVSWIIKPSS